MIALRLCWTIFALWYMWWGSTHLLISTQITDAKFGIEKGTRYECGVTANRKICRKKATTTIAAAATNGKNGLARQLKNRLV